MKKSVFVCALLATSLASAAPPAAPTPASSPAPAPTAATPAARADATFTAWDADHDGRLTQAEFRNGWVQMAQRQQVELRLRMQFNKLDANHDEAIDAKEYANVELARQAGAGAPLSRFDSDRDGKLSITEYLWLVSVLAPHAAAPAPAGH